MQKRTLWVTLHTHPYLFLSTYLLIITIQTHTYDIREATHFPSFSVTNRRTYREPLEFDSKTDRESDRKVMSSAKKVANAVGGKTARACDSCITKRARWYCAADDAFLCQACDSSVHSANPLARRHERVRLKTTSYNNNKSSDSSALTPSWHHGFTKKARTPRHGGKSTTHSTNYSSTPTHKSWSNHPFHLVPEEGHSEEVNSQDEEMSDEAQLLYRVPIFDPFVEAELCSPPSSVNSAGAVTDTADVVVENKGMMGSESMSMSMSKVVCCFNNGGVESSSSSSLQGLLATEIELAQFAADVESLLGRELENECIGMEELGLLVDNNQKEKECSVKVEHNNNNNSEEQSTEEVAVLDVASSRGGEPPFELSFDYDYDHDYDEVKKQEEAVIDDLDKQAKEEEEEEEEEDHDEEKIRRKILLMLQLDYEGVITAWASEKKSPWTTPHKPNLLDHHHCMVGSSVCGTQIDHPYGEMFGLHPAVTMGDGGREARVSRYREKRRTRLFSKKIRYEVRKLNAEKRPRMKGRFVKRASFAAPPTFSLAK